MSVMRPFPQLQHILPARPSGAITALDIGPDGIVGVACGHAGRSIAPARLRPLPPGVVTDGEVTDAEALADELRAFVSEHDLPRDVRVGLAHSRLVVRTIEVSSVLEGEQLDAAVRHFAEGLLPMALDEVALDYQRTGLVPGDPTQQRILIAAARLAGVERLMQALALAGLRPRKLSLCGLALLRALDPVPLPEQAILYVQAASLTNIVVAEDGVPVLVRVASVGSEAVSASLAERAGIAHLEARARAAEVGVAEGSAADDEVTRLAVREGLHRVVAEIHSSLEFYAGQEDARPVGAVVVTGSMSTWPGVADAIADELALPVLPAGRDGWHGLDAGSVPREALDVAVGLALAPADAHPDLRPSATRSFDRTASPRVAQALCGVSAVLAAVMVYFVVASNQVTGHEQRADRLAGESVAAERKAAELKPYQTFADATAQRRETVAAVAESRFDWARVLRQLAQRTPDDVWLTSVEGTSTAPTASAGTAPVSTRPTLALVGCAAGEKRVPDYMERLRSIGRVADVGFNRSERLDAKQGQAAGAGGGGEDCRDGDDRVPRFDLMTHFEAPPPLPAAAPAAGAQPAGAPAPTSGNPAQSAQVVPTP